MPFPPAVRRLRAIGTTVQSASQRMVSSGSTFSTALLDAALASGGPFAAVGCVVDAGCGPSPHRSLMPAARYVGVDRTPRPPSGVLGVIGDVTALPLAAGVADGVICTEVIEHVADERELGRELARVARPGAVLLLSSPFVHGLHEQPYDFRRLTSIGLTAVLAESGWVVEQTIAVGGPLAVTLDTAVRSGDATLRRVVGRLLGRSGRTFRTVASLSTLVQEVLAALVLAGPSGRFRPIDPAQPMPRLTLGYVVVARRDVSHR